MNEIIDASTSIVSSKKWFVYKQIYPHYLELNYALHMNKIRLNGAS